MSPLYYPDVSNNNWGSQNLTDAGQQALYNFLGQLVPQGFAGVCHKMSQGGGGNGYIDPYGALAQTWCQQNNMPFIGYHWVTQDDPASQAQTWQAAGGGANVMFDFEQGPPSSGDMSNFWNVANAFNAVGVNVQLGYIPAWYLGNLAQSGGDADISGLASNGILLVSSGYPLGSQADFASNLYTQGGGDSGEGWAPYNGGTPSAWQFTSSAIISGFNGVDCNAYLGSDINVLFGTAVAPPPPPPPPSPPPPPPPVPVPPQTPEEFFAQLMNELSASGDVPLTAATNSVPAPKLTAREAWNAILWVTNAAVDMLGTGSTYGTRPWPPQVPDTILGHILSCRAENLQILALLAALCEAAQIDVATILAQVKANIEQTSSPPAAESNITRKSTS